LEKRPGIDIPLQSAPLERRLLSALIDDAIIAAACAIFGFIFWKLTAIRPPRLQIIGVLAGLGFVLWAVYQYLLVVYAGTTPGLRLADWNCSASMNGGIASAAPLARPGILSFGRLARHGICLGFPGRRLAVLARQDYPHVPRAEEA